MIATSGFLAALEHTKFVFGRGSAPDPTGGAYSAPPDPLAGLRGPTSKEIGMDREKGKREKKGRGSEPEGPAPFRKFLDPPLEVHMRDSLFQIQSNPI